VPTTLDLLAAGKYLSLTTFRRDGTPVATPVWLVRDGEALLVITGAESGKARRLRAGSRALVAPCDMRGNPTGETVPATAELLGPEETARAASEITRRYGLLGRLFMWRSRHSERVGIRVQLAP
jgi:PPOX class probable F420-dependent enzyme